MKFSISFFFFFSTQILLAQDGFVKCEFASSMKPATNSLIYDRPIVDNGNAMNALPLFFSKVVAESKDWIKVTHLYEGCIQDGYILRKDALLDFYFWGNKLIKTRPLSWSGSNKEFLVVLEVNKTKEILDTLTLFNEYHGADIMDSKFNSGLKNVARVLRFNSFRESCPGLSSNDYILLTEDNKFMNIINETSTGEIGWITEKIYQPIQFRNGNVKMVYVSDDDQILNWNTGNLNEFQKAKQFNIPFNELIIKEIEVAEPVFKNDRYVEDEHGEYVVKIS